MRRTSTGFAEHPRRYGRYARVLQRFGHVRPFTFVIRYAGSKVDLSCTGASRGRVTLAGPGLPTMLLTTRGRRTGKPRTVPVFYVRDGRNLVAASENFGLAAAASWPGNLRADLYVTIQVGSTSASYRARPATAAEVDQAMPRLLSIWPAHETYLQRTGTRYVFVFEPLRGSSRRPSAAGIQWLPPQVAGDTRDRAWVRAHPDKASICASVTSLPAPANP